MSMTLSRSPRRCERDVRDFRSVGLYGQAHSIPAAADHPGAREGRRGPGHRRHGHRLLPRGEAPRPESPQAGTCGLHVHVNRSSLGNTSEQREDTIARILFFVENHWNELLRFSRRTGKQMEKWAARYGRKDDPKAVLHSAKVSENGRYRSEEHTSELQSQN